MTGYYPPAWWLHLRSQSVTLQTDFLLSPQLQRELSLHHKMMPRLSPSLQFPATLLGYSLMELGAYFARCGLRGSRSPFGEERIAQPGNS